MKLLTKLKSSTSSPRRQQFFNLMVFFLAYVWPRKFSLSVLKPHLLSQGLSLQQLMLGTTFVFLGAVILILAIKRINSKNSWRLAIISAFTFILLITKIVHPYQYYLATIISGFSIIFYFVPYNIVHFQLTPTHRTGLSSAIFFSVHPIISLFAPLLAGFLAQQSYSWIWVLSGIFYFLTFSLVKYQKSFNINYQIKSSFKAIKATRVFIFLQGIWESLVFGIIPIFSLFFIKSPLHYGTYMAYLALMGILANLSLGRLTDKLQKRTIFLYPLTIILGITTLLFPLSLKSIFWWIIITGVIQFFLPLFWNVSTAMVIDSHTNVKQVIPVRELLLSLGRVLGLSLAFINFQFESRPTIIFYFLGSIMFLYPLILFYNTKISKKYTYL